MKTDRIHSFTGLRAFAMMTVFCSHLDYLAETAFKGLHQLTDNGGFGVDFFLALSGFVIALSYSDKLKKKDRISDVRFIKKRISNIYVPYIIAMMLALPLYIFKSIAREGALDIKLMVTRLIINIGMLQSAIPIAKYSVSINDVAWFISTIFIIYLLAPSIIRLNHKAVSDCRLLTQVGLIAVIQLIYCCIYMGIREIEFIRFADYGLSIIYRSPVIRIFPFLLGIICYNIYYLYSGFKIKDGSYVEIAALAVFILWWIAADEIGLPRVVIECINMLVSMIVILTFAFSKEGIVSDLTGKGPLYKLGGISLEFYLIHFLVIEYGTLAAKRIGLYQEMVVLPLTILYLAVSFGIAYAIHYLRIKKT